MHPTLAKVMSNAPSDNFENPIDRAISSNISSLTGTGAFAASRLRRDNSLSGLNGLIARSMRCISSITAAIAASPIMESSCHSSTRIEVPMMASSLLIHFAGVGLAPERNPGTPGISSLVRAYALPADDMACLTCDEFRVVFSVSFSKSTPNDGKTTMTSSYRCGHGVSRAPMELVRQNQRFWSVVRERQRRRRQEGDRHRGAMTTIVS